MARMRNLGFRVLIAVLACLPAARCLGWGRDGHKLINRVAVQTLPADVPAFLRGSKAIAEIGYLGPEPDRWRSPAEPELSAAQAPEHFLDMELAEMAAPGGLPERRFDYLLDLYLAQKRHPADAERFKPQTVGLLPWQMDEYLERLEADMRHYRERKAAQKPLDGPQLAIIYDAGVLGHYVADGSQPLHTTVNYNGWAQRDNPDGFTRERGIHSQFESDFVHENMRASNVLPLVPTVPRLLSSPFQDILAYLQTSHGQVREVYELEKQGALTGKGSAESRSFTAERLAAGATMLRDMIYTAWVRSAEPVPEGH
jgi:hypothetical protein